MERCLTNKLPQQSPALVVVTTEESQVEAVSPSSQFTILNSLKLLNLHFWRTPHPPTRFLWNQVRSTAAVTKRHCDVTDKLMSRCFWSLMEDRMASIRWEMRKKAEFYFSSPAGDIWNKNKMLFFLSLSTPSRSRSSSSSSSTAPQDFNTI